MLESASPGGGLVSGPGGVSAPGGMLVSGPGVVVSGPGGVSAPGGGWHPSMHWGRPPPPLWTEWMTDRCKNITLATTSSGRNCLIVIVAVEGPFILNGSEFANSPNQFWTLGKHFQWSACFSAYERWLILSFTVALRVRGRQTAEGLLTLRRESRLPTCSLSPAEPNNIVSRRLQWIYLQLYVPSAHLSTRGDTGSDNIDLTNYDELIVMK